MKHNNTTMRIKEAIPFAVFIAGMFSFLALWIFGLLGLGYLATDAQGTSLFITVPLGILYTGFLAFLAHIFANLILDWEVQ